MHILYLGSFAHSWSTENYIARALEREGCEVSSRRVGTAHQKLRTALQ